MNSRVVMYVALFFFLGFALQYGKETYNYYVNEQNAIDSLEQIYKDAAENNSAVPLSIEAAEEVSKMARETLDEKENVRDKRLFAAQLFWGYYNSNVKARRDYCDQQGVDITPFILAFKEAHTREERIARDMYSRASISLSRVYDRNKELFVKMVSIEMRDAASVYDISEEEACKLFIEFPNDFVSNMHFSIIQPEIHSALIDE